MSPEAGAVVSSEERVSHPLFARLYIRGSRRSVPEEDAHRRRLVDGLSGRVIEVGAGNGLNFRFYPASVEQVVAVEPEPLLRAKAVEAARTTSVPITVIEGVAARLLADDESFDAGVASLMLCSVPDQKRALAEFHRVIRPGGELRFYEHVVSERPGSRRLQRLADATVWPHVAGGCHLSRDTGAAIAGAGFAVERCERFSFSPVGIPKLPHILGVARRS
jgi:SAM-dependent methyltransferase